MKQIIIFFILLATAHYKIYSMQQSQPSGFQLILSFLQTMKTKKQPDQENLKTLLQVATETRNEIIKLCTGKKLQSSQQDKIQELLNRIKELLTQHQPTDEQNNLFNSYEIEIKTIRTLSKSLEKSQPVTCGCGINSKCIIS